ncbi:MAG: M48 family metalloprotease, partial [Bryobacteraceae bacterium]
VRWWFYAWCVAIPLTVLLVYVEPFVIEPLFNRFEPLGVQYPQLATQIEEILARAHVRIPRDHLFVMKASEKTNELNAYVSGFGSSKRVVLYDTIIAKEPGPPLLTTIGHELGHYVLNHIAKGIGFGLVMTFFGFLAAHLLLRWSVPIGAWGTVPLLLLLFTVGSFLGDPIANAFSRHLEHEADRYALEVTHGIVPDAGKAAAVAFQIEGETDLEDPSPGPFVKFWLYSHPPIADRLRFALDYDPWREGQKPKYVR